MARRRNIASRPAASDRASVLDVAEAARLLHLNPKRVQSLARDGKLPAARVGRKWLFRRDALEARLGLAPAAGSGALAISARNRLRGTIARLEVEGLMAEVVVRIGDQELVSVITRASAERLKLAVGAPVFAVIKSTEVMLGREGIDG